MSNGTPPKPPSRSDSLRMGPEAAVTVLNTLLEAWKDVHLMPHPVKGKPALHPASLLRAMIGLAEELQAGGQAAKPKANGSAAKKSSPAALAKYKQAWDLFDTDGDGTLTLDELSSVMKELGHPVVNAKKILAKADQNGDGVLDFDEFVAVMEDSASELQSLAQQRLIKRLTTTIKKMTGTVKTLKGKVKALEAEKAAAGATKAE